MVPQKKRPGMKPDLELDKKMMPLCAELRDWGLERWGTPGGWPSSFIQDVLHTLTVQVTDANINNPLADVLFTDCELSFTCQKCSPDEEIQESEKRLFFTARPYYFEVESFQHMVDNPSLYLFQYQRCKRQLESDDGTTGQCGGKVDVQSCTFKKLPHMFMVHFLDNHLIPEGLFRLGLPDMIRIGSTSGECKYEKYAIAVIVEISRELLISHNLNPDNNLHTYCYLKTSSGWIKVDNNTVDGNPVNDCSHKSYATGRAVVMYRKFRGHDKKFYPRFWKNNQ